jgi:pimeloyl-ACP methyl ester carboxylesterase
MFVELVRTTTSDGHRLDGSLLSAAPESNPRLDVDAFLFLHGVGGNFYAGNMFDHLARTLSQHGAAVLRVNTRGHDSISICWTSTGPLRHGAAYEVVDHCRYDVNTWITFLQSRGYSRIAVLGHSLGAIKAIYCAAQENNPATRCVVACSPPRLSYAAFMNSESQPKFFESLSTAREFVDKGQPEALFQAKFPFPILITAAGYLDKYGPDERYNILRYVGQVTCPMQIVYGQQELDRGGVAFAGLPDELRSRQRPDQQLQITTIAGADHVYTGLYDQLTAAILTWLTRN